MTYKTALLFPYLLFTKCLGKRLLISDNRMYNFLNIQIIKLIVN